MPGAAQRSPRIARIGILSDESAASPIGFDQFARELREFGWVEGRNVAFEKRFAEQRFDALPQLAAELTHRHIDLIFAIGTPAAQAAKGATQTIPVVFARASNPLASGLTPSLSRPGGNVTGVASLIRDLDVKRLELLSAAVPQAKRIGVLWDPRFPRL